MRIQFLRNSLVVLYLGLVLAILAVVGVPAHASAQSFHDAPFDQSGKSLLAGYYGYSPGAFVRGYRTLSAKLKSERQKGEFETTEAYRERLKKLDSHNPFTSGTYAFTAEPTTSSYDADTQTFALRFMPTPSPVLGVNDWTRYASVKLKETTKGVGHYEAENSFGARVTVDEAAFSFFYILLVQSHGTVGCTASAKVPLASAKAMNPDIRALLIIRPVAPYARENTSYTEPTFNDPSENTLLIGTIFGRLLGVRFYDWRTGQTIASCL